MKILHGVVHVFEGKVRSGKRSYLQRSKLGLKQDETLLEMVMKVHIAVW